MIEDRPFLGIALMLGFCIVAPLADAVAKVLGGLVPIGMLLLFRFAIQAGALIPILRATGRPWRMRGRVLRLTVLRTLLHMLGIGMMVLALQYLPLADAVAIGFVMPFILLVLGGCFLDETVGRRRILACLAGFAGTLLVIQPSFAAIGWPALLPLGVALNFSVFILITRQIAKDTDPIGLQAVSGILATAILAPAILLFGDALPALSLHQPDLREWGLLLAIGLLGTLAHLLMTWSLRYAPAATMAPMQYLEIPIAALLGLAFWGDWPNPMAQAGIALTIAAGLYVMLTERRATQAPPLAPAPATPPPAAPVPQPAE